MSCLVTRVKVHPQFNNSFRLNPIIKHRASPMSKVMNAGKGHSGPPGEKEIESY